MRWHMDEIKDVTRRLCEELHIYKMLKRNIKELDSFELNALGYVSKSLKDNIVKHKMTKSKLEKYYKEFIKENKLKEK
jgi:hypothetical protein